MEHLTDKRKETNWVVYMHTHRENGKRYIGITCQKPTKRWQNGAGYMGSPFFYAAIQKYGWDAFEHEILYTELTQSEAERLEIELIAKYQTRDTSKGYNRAEGGAVNQGWTRSPELRAKDSELKRGANNPHYGKPRPPEVRAAISAGERGKFVSAETRARIGASKRGVTQSAETIQKRREAVIGRFKGANNSLSKPVLCVETGVVYPSMSSAAEAVGARRGNICNACRGERETTGGYHWRYADEAVTVDG